MIREEFRVHSLAGGKRRTMRKTEEVYEITQLKVEEEVWAQALRISGGDLHRIEIISKTEVLVHNKPHRRKNR